MNGSARVAKNTPDPSMAADGELPARYSSGWAYQKHVSRFLSLLPCWSLRQGIRSPLSFNVERRLSSGEFENVLDRNRCISVARRTAVHAPVYGCFRAMNPNLPISALGRNLPSKIDPFAGGRSQNLLARRPPKFGRSPSSFFQSPVKISSIAWPPVTT